MSRETINVARARHLYRMFGNWKRVANAPEMRRRSGQKFQPYSIQRAVRAADRASKPA